MARNPWNDITITALKAHWTAGLSCSQIAEKIPGTTKNSVIGKARRVGLPGRLSGGKPGNPNFVRRPQAAMNTATLANRIKTARIRAEYVRTLDNKTNIRKDDVARKALADLEDKDCRFVVGEPSGTKKCFCADPQIPGSSYCLPHFLATTSPVPVKTRPTPVPVRETEEAR